MKPFRSHRGSALVITVLLTFSMTIVAGALIAAAIQSYRLEKRNEAMQEARKVAESEIEGMFYRFKNSLAGNKPVDTLPSSLGSILDYSDPASAAAGAITTLNGSPTTSRAPFIEKYRLAGWTVMRSLTFNINDHKYGAIPNNPNGHVGHFYYMTAEAEAIPPPSYAVYGSPHFRVGRRFIYSVSSSLQNSLFYQGDLELMTGSDLAIKGDITVNGSIYMGATNGAAVDLYSFVRLTGQFENALVSGDAQYFKPGVDHSVVSGGVTAPTFMSTGGQGTQLKTMTTEDNFLGGISAGSLVASRSDLFPDQDSVFRSIIAAPPYLYDANGELTVANSHDYPGADPSKPDDPTIANVRVYNMASLIVTIAPNGTATMQAIDSNGKPQDVTSSYAGAVSPPTQVWDERENKVVSVSNVDVSKLAGLATADWFQGVVYVNEAAGSDTAPTAIRLINAATIPQKAGVGFTLATNGGLYIKGDYNLPAVVGGDPAPSVLMADAVTVLSPQWTDSTVSRPMGGAGGTGTARVATSNVTINSGIMTGNTSATATSLSGGAQNLVRYEENWSQDPANPGYKLAVTLNGSLGRLFDSKYFDSPYTAPSTLNPLTNLYSAAWYSPPTRNIQFDPNLPKQNTKGAPSTKDYRRGNYFSY